jgi:hypothetical protein
MAGEVSIAESNELGRKEGEARARARRTNPRVARGQHQVVVPLWMDGPYIGRCMAEWGCDRADAVARIRREGGDAKV